jgi:hypothetical protein
LFLKFSLKFFVSSAASQPATSGRAVCFGWPLLGLLEFIRVIMRVITVIRIRRVVLWFKIHDPTQVHSRTVT